MARDFEQARPEYAAFVNERMVTKEFNRGYGKCRETCEAMIAEFPDLEIRKGIFQSAAWGPRQHWWCRHGDQIVDPTAAQHPDGEVFPFTSAKYVDLTDVSEEDAIDQGIVPSGRCPDCGDYVYRGESFCSEECARRYEAYILGGEL